jgi:hypothetical protein
VVVAVVAVRVVEPTVYEIVEVVAVRHRLVAAAGAVGVIGTVPGLGRVVGVRVGLGHADAVLFDAAVGARVVQVTTVQIVGVTVVGDGGVAAAITVLVGVVGVRVGHLESPF